jgi:hypothetical protein
LNSLFITARPIFSNQKEMTIHRDYKYISIHRSTALTGTSEARVGKVLVVVFKKHKRFNFRKSDFTSITFFLPLKTFFSPGTAYGIIGGSKEGIFSKVWWEIDYTKQDMINLIRKYRNPNIGLKKRIRSKNFTEVLNALYHAKSLGLKYKHV